MKKRKSLGLLVSAPRIQELNGPDEYVSDLALILSSSNSEIPVDNLVVLAVETECRAGTNLDDQLRRSTLEKGRTSMLTFLNLKVLGVFSDIFGFSFPAFRVDIFMLLGIYLDHDSLSI